MSLLKRVTPNWKMSWHTRKVKSTKSTRVRRKRGRGRMRRKAAQNPQNRRKSHHHRGPSGPHEPAPDWLQQQVLEITLLQKGTAKNLSPQRETLNPRSTKDMQAKRKRKNERKTKSRRKSLNLVLLQKAVQRRAQTLRKSLLLRLLLSL